jgi:hypothetical protein
MTRNNQHKNDKIIKEVKEDFSSKPKSSLII